MIDILYFASLRDLVGTATESMAPPSDLTVEELIATLGARNGAWARAFGGDTPVLVALNQSMARPEDRIRDGDEVAFFPPVTGG